MEFHPRHLSSSLRTSRISASRLSRCLESSSKSLFSDVLNVSLRLMVDARDTALPGSYGGSFRYKVSEGRTEQEDHYGGLFKAESCNSDLHTGIRLAQLASLPDEVLRRADEVAKQLSTLEAQGEQTVREPD